ncbi:tetratricopeptide [Metarhizium robertsii ARSEF 23]|uniref:Tetratricopeptide n=1 Tax=Metarhizium robertsii (strain ARSEF 23 / ATCC MYA-3075) TaxID=655844 RepID=E9FB72_METRA|nr:tetratricopeptide [Metarhizium robertsii ARSEF 23]EFY95072.2 tetratricopeptide [Metarhizium robertsii ARSEF 23]
MSTQPQTATDDAAKARALGNELYRAGKLLQAEKAYKTAASLAPHDPSPVSNLSAVRYEMGDYKGAIAHIRDAISLTVPETDNSAKNDKLYSRLVKCFLYLHDVDSAEDAVSSIGDAHLRAELDQAVGSMKALLAEAPDESVLRRQLLDRIPRYKPCPQDIAEYFCVGHDQLEMLTEPLGMTGDTRPDISILFAGFGDGRNLFSALITIACMDGESRLSSLSKLHFTVLDLKVAALARLLIFFNMMERVDPAVPDDVSDYPTVRRGQAPSNIRELIKRLEGIAAPLQFVYIRDHDREPLLRVLRQWQQPWDGFSKIADVRRLIEQNLRKADMRAASLIGEVPEFGPREEREDFRRFHTLLPPMADVKRCEPSLVELLAKYRSSGKGKKLYQYIDAHWRFNNTLVDYDFANRRREQGNDVPGPFDFHPLEVIESMRGPGSTDKADISCIQKLAEVFRVFNFSILMLDPGKRLVVEVIAGEMADIMDRMRYNLLDHRMSPPENSRIPDPTLFPRTFDYIHMSNIPDYIGGHLTSFLTGRPLLKEDQPSSLRFTNLLNPPEFENHEAFRSEYLLMYNMERIRQHFLLTQRPGEFTEEASPPTISPLHSFVFEQYTVWDSVPRSVMPFQKLLSKAGFEKWVYGHLLKICLPHPRPVFSDSPVYAPLNLTALIHLVVGMFEVGYPAHWLVRILSCICTGVITTSARPPERRVYTPAQVDAFTTLVSIWRRLLPFGIDSSLSASLVSLETIHLYSIAFPPFPAISDHRPQSILVFWNTEVGDAAQRLDSLYDLLDGSGGDDSKSARNIREKGVVCVTTFRFTTASRTAEFWMRADKMEQMMAGKWRAFLWRTDEWEASTRGVDVSRGVTKGKKWTTDALLGAKPEGS